MNNKDMDVIVIYLDTYDDRGEDAWEDCSGWGVDQVGALNLYCCDGSILASYGHKVWREVWRGVGSDGE